VQLSQNWSGYAVTSTPGTPTSTFTSVQGTFDQPSIVCNGKAGRFVADWVGLDGFKDETVEQDGTFATCTGKNHRTPAYVAWYEMYPAGSVEVFPVNAGDEIEPSVTFADGSFSLSITDATTDQTQSILASCGSCHRASAEWIIERPALCTKKGKCFLSVLPDFDTATLSSDTATTTAMPTASAVSSFTDTPIDMIQPKGPSVELLDQTDPLGTTGDTFTAQWERSGHRLPISL
jgi:cytochrome c553